MADGKNPHPARRRLAVLAGIAVAVLLIIWAVYHFAIGQYYVATDDAYLAADTAMMAPKIGGYVTAVPVNLNQKVKAGQVLAAIDDRDYRAAIAGAAADVQAAQAAIQSDQAQLSLQQAKIAAAQADVAADQARLVFAAQDARRYARASASGAGTEQSSSQAGTGFATARAAVAADQANLLGTQRQVDVLTAERAQSQASLAQAEAKAEQAGLDLSHTEILAPFDGVVANKTVQVGDYLQPGTDIMAVVPLGAVYVLANYKETQITNIRPGQSVKIAVDGFPDLKVTGHVDSISPSSGQEFALLPPDNATGNFTKIVQRVPVKIALDLTPHEIGELLPGMSVEPVIDTKASH